MHRTVIALAALAVVVIVLAIPSIIAFVRYHPERSLIYRLSPLGAFSFALWLVLIAWAASDKRDDAVISLYVAKLRKGNKLPFAIGLLIAIGLAGALIPIFQH